MGVGTFMEPLVVVTLLFGGTWVNRNKRYQLFGRQRVYAPSPRSSSPGSFESGRSSPSSSSSASLLHNVDEVPKWRKREIRIMGLRKEVVSPNTKQFQDYFLSRLLMKFPFLVEAWYWALIYWVYQLGRAFTAVTMVEGTVNVARRHALQVIHLEQRLHIFHELAIQNWFLQYPTLMHWTNRIYSFIHIPGTILFLVALYAYTTATSRPSLPLHSKAPSVSSPYSSPYTASPLLYAARRRTMAVCNLLAFIVFTLWPCMPPRLLSDPTVPGAIGHEARSYRFIDTVHGAEGESSVWTTNKFCNQYAAMPSLHFGYSLLIGLTICGVPLEEKHSRARTVYVTRSLRIRVPAARRLACLAVGIAYPVVILAAIVATANHFLLDAVAGAVVCALAWNGNRVLLNLLPVEDWFLWVVRIHKPARKMQGLGDEEVTNGGWKGAVVE